MSSPALVAESRALATFADNRRVGYQVLVDGINSTAAAGIR